MNLFNSIILFLLIFNFLPNYKCVAYDGILPSFVLESKGGLYVFRNDNLLNKKNAADEDKAFQKCR